MKVVDNPEKPTELLIGEIGDFLRTQEFSDKRFEFANMLYEKTEECIKMRTLLTNYASFYAFFGNFSKYLNQFGENLIIIGMHFWTGLKLCMHPVLRSNTKRRTTLSIP